ncbi:MAG: hypothetical protein KME52_28340 [Desmonostoc geniculatum HA4340-LM1]|jgi:hypothetical protein|nr:hypothetical protein [Desmonostoc geniculatum HA4340-LM1]
MRNWRHHAFTAFIGTILGTVAVSIVLAYKQPVWNISFDVYGRQFTAKLAGVQCLSFYPVEWLISSAYLAYVFHYFEEAIEEAERASND